MNENIHWRVCKMCGREFLWLPEWVYKARDKNGHTVTFCRYNCMMKYEKEREKK